MAEPRSVEDRLGTVERHTNSNDQRLTKMQGLYESLHTGISNILAFQQAHSERIALMDTGMSNILAFQQAHSERIALMDERFTQRFDDLEKVVVEIRDSLNGQ